MNNQRRRSIQHEATKSTKIVWMIVLVVCASIPHRAAAQTVTQRGFVEARAFVFPLDAANDTQNLVVDVLARGEAFATLSSWLQLAAGVDVRANSQDQVKADLDFRDRGLRRPFASIRRLSATITHGPLTFDGGKQFIRWGKTDIVTPTDRFAPRDFLNVIDNEILPVIGGRLTLQANDDTLEAVLVPFVTPSRLPLAGQRWGAGAPPPPAGFTVINLSPSVPEKVQTGVRWAHTGSGYEYALMFFDGVNHLPDIRVRPGPLPLDVEVFGHYPEVRTYGADVAVPTTWFTAKGEAAYFTSREPDSDEYVLYVLQLERQTGEWLITGGYAGETVTRRRALATFAPDRGLTRTVIARASYTIDPTRSAAIEGAVRENGNGVYVKGEYSWLRGQHWRTTVTGALLAGEQTDFLGQYRRNSHVSLAVRYSF